MKKKNKKNAPSDEMIQKMLDDEEYRSTLEGIKAGLLDLHNGRTESAKTVHAQFRKRVHQADPNYKPHS